MANRLQAAKAEHSDPMQAENPGATGEPGMLQPARWIQTARSVSGCEESTSSKEDTEQLVGCCVAWRAPSGQESIKQSGGH